MLQSFRSWDYYKYQLKAVFRSSFKGRKKKSTPNIKSHTYLKYSISLQVSKNAPPMNKCNTVTSAFTQRSSHYSGSFRQDWLWNMLASLLSVEVAKVRGRCVTGGKFLYRVNIHCINKPCFSFCYQTKVFPLSNLYCIGWKYVLSQTKNQNPYFQSVIANRSEVPQ